MGEASKIRIEAMLSDRVKKMQSDPEYIAAMNDAYAGFGVLKTMADGTMKRIAPEDFRNLYLGTFPPPPKVGDSAMWKGRIVLIKAIEPGGEKDRAIVQDAETGREREVNLSALVPI